MAEATQHITYDVIPVTPVAYNIVLSQIGVWMCVEFRYWLMMRVSVAAVFFQDNSIWSHGARCCFPGTNNNEILYVIVDKQCALQSMNVRVDIVMPIVVLGFPLSNRFGLIPGFGGEEGVAANVNSGETNTDIWWSFTYFDIHCCVF